MLMHSPHNKIGQSIHFHDPQYSPTLIVRSSIIQRKRTGQSTKRGHEFDMRIHVEFPFATYVYANEGQ